MYFLLNKTSIGLKLRFTGPPGADTTTESLQVAPLPGQTRIKILMLGQFYLQLAFTGLGLLGKDIQDQGDPDNNLYLKKVFQVSLLQW